MISRMFIQQSRFMKLFSLSRGRLIGAVLCAAWIVSVPPLFLSASAAHAPVVVPARPLLIGGKPTSVTGGSLRFTGTVHTRGKEFILSALGYFHVAASTLAWPAGKSSTLSAKAFVATGHLNFWHDSKGEVHMHVKHAEAAFESMRIKSINITHGNATWSLLHKTLKVSLTKALWKKSPVTASGTYNFATHRGTGVIVFPNVQQQQIFALMVPGRVNIVGRGDIHAILTCGANGVITGEIQLVGKTGGFLQLHQIPLLRSVLAGSYGQALAAAMADDLHDYPFTKEDVNVRMTKSGMTFTMDFVRGRGNPMHLKARKVVIDGKTMIFRARDLKTVHLVIPVLHLTAQRLVAIIQRFSQATKTR